MKINFIQINYEGNEKIFTFAEKNLIHSEKNSVGKSTLLRLLFYAMGYQVPGTKRFHFNQCETKIEIARKGDLLLITRKKNIVNILINNSIEKSFIIPEEEAQLLSLIWANDNIDIINNILGAIYFDQEKGWTLLNRGKVIGNIPFNIEELLRGLASKDAGELLVKKQGIKTEINKYQHLQSVIQYKNQITEKNTQLLYPNHVIALNSELDQLRIETNLLNNKIKSINQSLKDNNNFLRYIENMKISVVDPTTDIRIPVNMKTIEHFDENQKYLDVMLNIEKINLAKIEHRILEINNELEKYNMLFNVQSEIERFNDEILKFNFDFDYTKVEKIINELKKKEKKLNKSIKELTFNNNSYVSKMQKNISAYAERLKLDDIFGSKGPNLLTNDLKSYSGAILHKLVFSYKMAYIKELESILEMSLPIILDSPSGRELDKDNLKETFKILDDDFKSNQVITASIFTNFDYTFDNTISIKKTLLESASSLI